MADTLRISGLKEFRGALKQLDKGLPKGLRVAFNGSADFLIGKVRPQIPKLTGRAARSVKARSSQTEVRVAVGGRQAPWYPWLDFGGRTGRKRSVDRPFIKEGRYLYPTFHKYRAEFTKITEGALVSLAEDAGLDVD